MELYLGLSKDTEITINLNQISYIYKLLLKYKNELVRRYCLIYFVYVYTLFNPI